MLKLKYMDIQSAKAKCLFRNERAPLVSSEQSIGERTQTRLAMAARAVDKCCCVHRHTSHPVRLLKREGEREREREREKPSPVEAAMIVCRCARIVVSMGSSHAYTLPSYPRPPRGTAAAISSLRAGVSFDKCSPITASALRTASMSLGMTAHRSRSRCA